MTYRGQAGHAELKFSDIFGKENNTSKDDAKIAFRVWGVKGFERKEMEVNVNLEHFQSATDNVFSHRWVHIVTIIINV